MKQKKEKIERRDTDGKIIQRRKQKKAGKK